MKNELKSEWRKEKEKNEGIRMEIEKHGIE